MNPVALDLGLIEIKWYSLFIFLGILIGGGLIVREGKKFKIDSEIISNLIFWAMIFGLIGARLYYVAFNWDMYSSDLLSIIKVWEGGLAIHGGILAGGIVTFLYTKKYNIKFLLMTDIVVVGVIIGQAIGRWGNFFNGEAYGPITTLEKLQSLFIPNFIIEGMFIGGSYHEPTFLYESLWCILGFGVILLIRRMKYLKTGRLTAIYLMWYSLGRFFIESLRTDSLMLGDFKVAQLVSFGLFAFGLILFIVKGRGTHFDNIYHNELVGLRKEVIENNGGTGIQF